MFFTAVNPQTAPAFEQKIMAIALKPVLYAELNKNFVSSADAIKNLLDDAVLVVLRINFEAVVFQTFFILEPFARRVLKLHARTQINLIKPQIFVQ